jgi:hypothetical protein
MIDFAGVNQSAHHLTDCHSIWLPMIMPDDSDRHGSGVTANTSSSDPLA